MSTGRLSAKKDCKTNVYYFHDVANYILFLVLEVSSFLLLEFSLQGQTLLELCFKVGIILFFNFVGWDSLCHLNVNFFFKVRKKLFAI